MWQLYWRMRYNPQAAYDGILIAYPNEAEYEIH